MSTRTPDLYRQFVPTNRNGDVDVNLTYGGSISHGATLTVLNGADLVVQSGGDLQVDAGATATFDGTLDANGTVDLTGATVSLGSVASLTVTGTLTLTGATVVGLTIASGQTLDVAAGGTLDITGATFTGLTNASLPSTIAQTTLTASSAVQSDSFTALTAAPTTCVVGRDTDTVELRERADLTRYTGTVAGSRLYLRVAQGTSGSPANRTVNQECGKVIFEPYLGGAFTERGAIACESQASTDDSKMTFVTYNGASSETALTLDGAAQQVIIGTGYTLSGGLSSGSVGPTSTGSGNGWNGPWAPANNPALEIVWLRIGDIVNMVVKLATGSFNADASMTQADSADYLPAAIRPALTTVIAVAVRDNGVTVAGNVRVITSGQLFIDANAGFTAGTCGLQEAITFTYNVT